MTEAKPGSTPDPSDLRTVHFQREGYRSPVGDRYGSAEMSAIWDPKYRLYKQRLVWLAVARTQMKAGLVTPEQFEDLVAHREDIDVDDINARENDRRHPHYVGHDVLAHIGQYADVAKIGGGALHRGLTSEDVLSNEEVLSIHESFGVIQGRMEDVLTSARDKIVENRNLVTTFFTHDQAAEPGTVGYRIANYAQDVMEGHALISYLQTRIKSKGIKGAVGTSAAISEMLEGTGMTTFEHEQKIMEELGIEPTLVSRQAYPRIFTYMTVAGLSVVTAATHKFAKDMKTLQSTPFGEVAEPRSANERGSSAMPHKKNPRHAENIKSLSRSVPGKAQEAWFTAADESLERGLEDSAGKRSFLPEAFLDTDEALVRMNRIMKGMQIRELAIQRNLNQSAPFAALEVVLSSLSRRGASRQEMHEVLAQKAQVAWDAVEGGDPNPLRDLVSSDPKVNQYLSPHETNSLFESVKQHIGDAPKRCDMMVAEIDNVLANRKQ